MKSLLKRISRSVLNEGLSGKTAGYQKAPSLNPSPLDGGREGGGWRWFWEPHPEISRRARYNRSTASHAASGGELPVKLTPNPFNLPTETRRDFCIWSTTPRTYSLNGIEGPQKFA